MTAATLTATCNGTGNSISCTASSGSNSDQAQTAFQCRSLLQRLGLFYLNRRLVRKQRE